MEPVRYIDRTRAYYLAEGYDKPYVWAHFDSVPFTRLEKPLAECRATIISTSDIDIRGNEGEDRDSDANFLVGNAYSIPSDTPIESLYSHQENYDVHATHLGDVDSYFPITRLVEAVAAGRLGSIAARTHGVYTSYSQRRTCEHDAPEILERCRADGVDVAVMTAICPVCHQTISLVARHLEANGIATVVMGTARDIVERCGVARFVFTDFPLGNPCGEPDDADMQRTIVGQALDLLETATAPRTTVQAPFSWSKGEQWKGLIFSAEQPFLEGEALEHWIAAKENYRRLKTDGAG